MHALPVQASSVLFVRSSAMRAARAQLDAFAPAPLPVVLVGPTGAGKSLLGRYLHERSGLAGAFVDCPCGELEPNLAKSDLFGHVRGAFTNAVARRRGRLAEAAGGTLMLDDFHLLRSDVQGLLLRALAEREYRELGAERSAPLTARVVFGMCEDPDALVAQGKLLPDLRSRLGQAMVRVPALTERREEIAPLARVVLQRYTDLRDGVEGPHRLSRGALAALEVRDWPGNVRDLEHVVSVAWELARYAGADEVEEEHLPPASGPVGRYADCVTTEQRLALVRQALARTGGRVGQAAKLIGAHRNTVRGWWKVLRGDPRHGAA